MVTDFEVKMISKEIIRVHTPFLYCNVFRPHSFLSYSSEYLVPPLHSESIFQILDSNSFVVGGMCFLSTFLLMYIISVLLNNYYRKLLPF